MSFNLPIVQLNFFQLIFEICGKKLKLDGFLWQIKRFNSIVEIEWSFWHRMLRVLRIFIMVDRWVRISCAKIVVLVKFEECIKLESKSYSRKSSWTFSQKLSHIESIVLSGLFSKALKASLELFHYFKSKSSLHSSIVIPSNLHPSCMKKKTWKINFIKFYNICFKLNKI